MAKGKGGSGKTYTSKGEHSNVSRSTRSAVRQSKSGADKARDKQLAWLKGQNPWVTIENPNKEETNKRFIRVKANEVWGNPKERAKKSFVML